MKRDPVFKDRLASQHWVQDHRSDSTNRQAENHLALLKSSIDDLFLRSC